MKITIAGAGDELATKLEEAWDLLDDEARRKLIEELHERMVASFLVPTSPVLGPRGCPYCHAVAGHAQECPAGYSVLETVFPIPEDRREQDGTITRPAPKVDVRKIEAAFEGKGVVAPDTMLFTVKEVAWRMGVHEATVRRWITKGALEHHRIGDGRSIRVSVTQLRRYIEGRRG